jgi:two-component system, LytTR family, response regulator
MIKAIIIEDELHQQELLGRLIKECANQIEIVGYAHSIAQSVELISVQQPDVVFLDIELGTESGLDLFRHCPNPSFETIITTAYNQYALQAIKLSCMDYLLKPVQKEDLLSALNKLVHSNRVHSPTVKWETLVSNLNSPKERERIVISGTTSLTIVLLSQLILCRAESNYTRIFTSSQGEIVSTTNLGEYESILPSTYFFRAHKSYLVNLNHIQKFNKMNNQLTLTGDLMADLAARKRNEFLDRIYQPDFYNKIK